MNDLPALDAHCHLASDHPSDKLADTGFAIALTLSLEEAEKVIDREEPHIAWGIGCYPRKAASQETFNIVRFRELVESTVIVGEIGLDTGSKVPIEQQTHNFRQILEVIAEHPRFVSIHSYRATGLVLKELRRTPISTPVLHWWTGSAEETSEAVELGCYFSIHSAVARHSKFRTRVPPERILVESDHGYGVAEFCYNYSGDKYTEPVAKFICGKNDHSKPKRPTNENLLAVNRRAAANHSCRRLGCAERLSLARESLSGLANDLDERNPPSA